MCRSCALEIYLIDGTYELFRHYYALPSAQDVTGREVAAVLAKFGHLEAIPADCREWRVNAANASALADTLCRERDRAMLFRTLATLRTDIMLFNDVDELRWHGPTAAFDVLAARLDGAAIKRPRPLVRRVPKRADSQS